MRKQLVLFALISVPLSGCAKRTPTEGLPLPTDYLDAFIGGKVEIVAQGGFAALDVHHVVRYDDRYFLFTQRHLCNNGCAALDSTSGALSRAAIDSLFTTVLTQSPSSLKDD